MSAMERLIPGHIEGDGKAMVYKLVEDKGSITTHWIIKVIYMKGPA